LILLIALKIEKPQAIRLRLFGKNCDNFPDRLAPANATWHHAENLFYQVFRVIAGTQHEVETL